MFCEDVKKRLELLERISVIISDQQLQLTAFTRSPEDQT